MSSTKQMDSFQQEVQRGEWEGRIAYRETPDGADRESIWRRPEITGVEGGTRYPELQVFPAYFRGPEARLNIENKLVELRVNRKLFLEFRPATWPLLTDWCVLEGLRAINEAKMPAEQAVKTLRGLRPEGADCHAHDNQPYDIGWATADRRIMISHTADGWEARDWDGPVCWYLCDGQIRRVRQAFGGVA